MIYNIMTTLKNYKKSVRTLDSIIHFSVTCKWKNCVFVMIYSRFSLTTRNKIIEMGNVKYKT